MDEIHSIIAVLLILAISVSAYFALAQGSIGAAIAQPYQSCCCNVLTPNGHALVRSQIQTFAPDCTQACARHANEGTVFPQVGLCASNP